jgi:two-component system cell cycle sensor histidine kinase/response regulator CckA
MGKVQEAGVRRSLEIIQRTAQDGAEVVRRVQRFSRVQPVSDVAVDLNQLVQEVVELTRPRWHDEAQLRGSRIEVTVEAGIIAAAAGEPAPLREVLMNLLLNAADAITQGGRVTLKTWAKDDRVYCSVTDTGGGMPEEVRRRALEPFFTTKGPKATGLGLSVAYGTVQRYGGTLTVESTVGQGTSVEVSLPTASAATAVAKSATVSAKAPALPLRILVIDDELQVRSTLAEMLEEQGHRVTQAPGGREGLSFLESNRELVDVVISDLGMPDMTGWDVAAAIQQRWPGVPVGLITGWGETEITREERSRVNFVINKPFDKAVLCDTMSDIRPRSAT